MALYPPLVVAATQVQALAWNLGWLALLLRATERARRRQPRAWIWFGLAAAGAALTDPILAAPAAALALWLLVGGWPRREFVRMALVAAALLAPWTIRNFAVHGRVIFVKNSLGYVLWQGNVPGSHGTDKLLPDRRPPAAASPAAAVRQAAAERGRSRSVDDLLTLGDLRRLSALPAEIDRMDWFAARLRQELAADPWQYPRMCWVRLRQWLWFDETNPRAAVWHYRVCYAALVAAAAWGVVRGAAPAGLAMPWLLAGLALTGVHVLVIASARFRIPAEMLLLAAAAGACVRPPGVARRPTAMESKGTTRR